MRQNITTFQLIAIENLYLAGGRPGNDMNAADFQIYMYTHKTTWQNLPFLKRSVHIQYSCRLLLTKTDEKTHLHDLTVQAMGKRAKERKGMRLEPRTRQYCLHDQCMILTRMSSDLDSHVVRSPVRSQLLTWTVSCFLNRVFTFNYLHKALTSFGWLVADVCL